MQDILIQTPEQKILRLFALNPGKPHSSRIILFGTYSRGTFTSQNDCEMFIVTENTNDVTAQIEHFTILNELSISLIIRTQDNWKALEKEDPFVFDQINRGLTLYDSSLDKIDT